MAIGSHQRALGRSNVWLTPPDIVRDLGPFDLDPCAAPDPRPWDTAARHITEDEDGLTQPWEGRVWLNPPYSRDAIAAWLRRMAQHGNGIALIFGRTDTDAFHRYVFRHADAISFLWGRLNFHHPDGRRADANGGAPSVLIAYGSANAERLRQYTGRPTRFVQLTEEQASSRRGE
jgi:hypothetical protein